MDISHVKKKTIETEKALTYLVMGVAFGCSLILTIVYAVMNWSKIAPNIISIVNINSLVLFFLFTSFTFLITDIIRHLLSVKYPEIKKTLRIISSIFFILIIFVCLVLSSTEGPKYQTSLTVLISSIVLGTGWWIQATINAASARKSHTINTIMNQRHSVHYFNKLDNVYEKFGLTSTIPLHIAEKYRCPDLDNRKVKKELISACRDASYILNYYEFISAGVKKGDFDEYLIRECFYDPMQNFENRAYHIIQTFRKEAGPNAEIFSNFIDLLDKWLPEKSLTTRNKMQESVPLYKVSHDESNSYEEPEDTCTQDGSSHQNGDSDSGTGNVSEIEPHKSNKSP